jgi:hypothetical protein
MGCGIDDVKIGMKLQARMEPHETGLTVPIFYPV